MPANTKITTSGVRFPDNTTQTSATLVTGPTGPTGPGGGSPPGPTGAPGPGGSSGYYIADCPPPVPGPSPVGTK